MFQRPALCLLLLLAGGGFAHAACSAYAHPTRMLKGDFLAADFGTIAIPRPGVQSQVLVFKNSSCYDVSGLALQSLKLFLNNRDAAEMASFFAANTIRAYDYDMAGEPQFQIKFRRNANALDSVSKWVRADDEEKLQEGSRFNGAFGIVLDREFDPDEKLPFSTLAEFAAVTQLTAVTGLMADWHAVIVPVTDSKARLLFPDRSYTVHQNTRFGIDPIGMDGIDLSAAPQATVISQIQLIKFQRLAAPTEPVQVLDVNIRFASCLYLRYRIDGESEIYLEQGNIPGDYLVLRLKAKANC
jgi:hypothetical protein